MTSRYGGNDKEEFSGFRLYHEMRSTAFNRIQPISGVCSSPKT